MKRIIRSDGAKADQRPLTPEPAPAAVQVARAREVAARVLLRRLHASAFIEDLLEDAFINTKMRADDRRLAQELVYGCVRWQGTLDWLVARRTEERAQLAPFRFSCGWGFISSSFSTVSRRMPPVMKLWNCPSNWAAATSPTS